VSVIKNNNSVINSFCPQLYAGGLKALRSSNRQPKC
jgi:hypothetical protein